MITEVPVITSVPLRRADRAPERLPKAWRSILLCGDIVVVLFVGLVALNGADSRLAASVVTAGIICGVFWQCGFYRRSYAVHPRDEAYYALAGVAFAALPIAIILATVAAVPPLSIAVTLLFSAIGTAAWRVRMHLERRPEARMQASIDTITPGAWHDRESAGYLLTKRIFDVVVAGLAVIVTFPIMLLAAIAIALQSGQPIFFRQERMGAQGRTFQIMKFRTMRADGGTQWVRPGDERITGLGAFLRRSSIDELPQLFNVLRGEMSIVGPRPEMVQYAASFAKTIANYDQRHVVSPGITGWAQLYCKRNLQPYDMAGVLPYDLFYIEHASLVIDVALLFKTVVEIFAHRGL